MVAATMLLPQRASLYVGDLDPEVTETDLKAVFLSVGPVLSLRLCRCASTGKSLCYGYVNFFTYYQACKAMQTLNHTYLKGKSMRIMWSQRNPYPRKTGIGNLFVKNLDASIDSAGLQKIFSKFGTVLSCKVVEEHGKSKGFGFVQFDLEDSALAARTALHDTVIEGKKLYVSTFVKKSARTEATPCEQPKSTGLFVENLALNVAEDDLQNLFSPFGKVSNVVIMKDIDGKSRGFGFVNFESEEDAKKAVDALNGSQQGSQTLYVGRAQTKAERLKTLQLEYKDTFSKRNLKDSNLYVKNLEISVNEDDLRELFRPWGKIVSAKVMRNDNGVSKGFGFVCFSGASEAWGALNSLRGSTVRGKRLYVAMAQRKKDRQMELQKYFAQCQSQSVYISNGIVVPPPIRPFYLNFSTCPQPVPYLQNPVPYQNFDTTMAFQYPLGAQSYRQSFSDYIPVGQTHRTCKNHADQSWQAHGSHLHTVTKNFFSEKRWNKRSEPAGSTAGGLPASSYTVLAKSPGGSKKRNLLYPHVENLQPELEGNILGLPDNKGAQVLKEAISLKSSDCGGPKPKSTARRLG